MPPTPTPVCSGNVDDSYETDDTAGQANSISTDGGPQCHVNTDPVGDQDWVTFEAVGGHAYEIATRLLNDIDMYGTAANDTLLYLYDTDGTTQLALNDDVGYTTWYQGYYYYRESIINWTAPGDGSYYIQELQWGPTVGNEIRDYHWYELWVLDLDAAVPEALAEVPDSPEAVLPALEMPTEEPPVTAETPTPDPAAATEAVTEEPPAPTEDPGGRPVRRDRRHEIPGANPTHAGLGRRAVFPAGGGVRCNSFGWRKEATGSERPATDS